MKNLKYLLLFFIGCISLSNCQQQKLHSGTLVSNNKELKEAIANAEPGTEIILTNGIWKNAQIDFYGKGTESQPITLRAEKPGKVFIEGESYLHLGGEHLIVDGLYFRNGYSPKRSLLAFQIGKDSTAFHSRITNCVIDYFTKPSRLMRDSWIVFYGKHNMLDHCYISSKSNNGATLLIFQAGNQHINTKHQIVHNYFGPRPRKGGPRAETIRIGDSGTSMTPGRVHVSHNYFEACNGEVEIISDKTKYNTFSKNIFYKCEGSLVMRHADYTTVEGNIFIGGDDSDFYGGIRVINTGHWITNNYFYKIRGEQFRSSLAIMNGIPKSALNRYKQVTDVVVAHNTWIDCKSPIQIGVGQNKESIDVLPKSEIRSAPPIRSIIANNLVYNTQADASPVVNHDDMSGILFKDNIIDNNGEEYKEHNVFRNEKVKMIQLNEWLFAPESGQGGILDSVYVGYDFDEKIKGGLFNPSITEKHQIGAINDFSSAKKFKIDKRKYGPTWFLTDKVFTKPNILSASSSDGELAIAIATAKSGDIIELTDAVYNLSTSLKIDKEITIQSKEDSNVQLVFEGEENTPVFEMNPKGVLRLKNIAVKGQGNQLAFAPLDKNMASAYNLFMDNCEIENFAYVLKATKGSFADSISIHNTHIQNCENGLVLAADEKGDYNAEMVFIDGCEFDNIQRNLIHFYRGGYDESTIGGFLKMTNNTISQCGQKEESGILVKTRGIINVLLSENTFRNNPVKWVAVLWGVKNNHHHNNTIIQSGKIKVQEQQKLELLY